MPSDSLTRISLLRGLRLQPREVKMPSVKVTTDKENRQAFKSRLAHLVDETLNSSPVESEAKVLLLPSNYAELQEYELLYALTQVSEFQHSRESAVLAVDILKGRANS